MLLSLAFLLTLGACHSNDNSPSNRNSDYSSNSSGSWINSGNNISSSNNNNNADSSTNSNNNGSGNNNINNSISKEEFSQAVSQRQASAQTTSYTKLTMQGFMEMNSFGQTTTTTVPSSSFDVTWSGNSPKVNPQAGVTDEATVMTQLYSLTFVLNSNVITTTDNGASTYYTNNDFTIESKVEITATDGNKTNATDISVWNDDL